MQREDWEDILGPTSKIFLIFAKVQVGCEQHHNEGYVVVHFQKLRENGKY